MKLSGSNSWLWAFLPSSLAFAPLSDQGLYSRRQLASSIAESRISLCASRRDVVEKLIQSSALGTAAALLMASPQEALASGGATAGGAYLLSAKQRYNERVKAGVQGFLALQPALEAGDNAAVRPYFTGEDTGTWKDITSAGYLLANAFRRSSNQAPDSLPSVKAWKRFAASVESVTKSLKQKDAKGALAAYGEALVLLDEYLKLVELPEAKEIAVA